MGSTKPDDNRRRQPSKGRTMLDVPVERSRIQHWYGENAPHYDELTAANEAVPKARALELLDRQPGERYLEVAIGTGVTFAEVVASSGIEGAHGVDLAAGMMDVARARLREQGVEHAPFSLADATALPFPDGSFDVVFNSYMLDLIPTEEIPVVLAEFRRVLRADGRLILVNLTEGEGSDTEFSAGWKQAYERDPEALGACRPVVVEPMARELGFEGLEREYFGHGASWPTEILTGCSP
jgi:ubiquinone/menaquinone biosynthesis C-methylase UbiE